jgi:hypothetical protein
LGATLDPGGPSVKVVAPGAAAAVALLGS